MHNLRISLSAAAMFLSSTASANWDGVTNGKINGIDVTTGQNYGFRVSLVGAPKLCGSNHGWAYLNQNDSNYQTYVAVLLAAKMADKAVTIFANRESTSGSNYCKIGYVALR